MVCVEDSDCWPAMAECDDDGSNQGTKRCRCARGYQKYNGKSNHTGTVMDQLLCGQFVTCQSRVMPVTDVQETCTREILLQVAASRYDRHVTFLYTLTCTCVTGISSLYGRPIAKLPNTQNYT